MHCETKIIAIISLLLASEIMTNVFEVGGPQLHSCPWIQILNGILLIAAVWELFCFTVVAACIAFLQSCLLSEFKGEAEILNTDEG